MCVSFGNMCTCIYCVLYCLYCVFCIVSFMYIFSYLFCLYCHRVTNQLQLIIIITYIIKLINIYLYLYSCIIHVIKDWLLCSKWMGSVKESSKGNKCIRMLQFFTLSPKLLWGFYRNCRFDYVYKIF
jgi:hypothetical protein